MKSEKEAEKFDEIRKSLRSTDKIKEGRGSLEANCSENKHDDVGISSKKTGKGKAETESKKTKTQLN